MSDIKEHPGLKIFKQHGFIIKGTSGQNQVTGRCMFCGHQKNFFINPEKKVWDCKTCGKEGGFKTLLVEIANHFPQYFTDEIAERLSSERGIAVETLQRHNVGYNPHLDAYLLPIPSMDRKDIWDVKIYKDKRLNISSGCYTALFRWEHLQETKSKDIWICEGEWDTMALEEMFFKLGIKDLVCGVPGAGTFKQDWAFMFREKHVRVLYDHDKAGEEGCAKVYKTIASTAKKISFIHWPESYAKGFDVRDFYKVHDCNPKRTFALLQRFLKDTPPGNDGAILQKIEKSKPKEYNGPGVEPKEVYAVFNKWLKLKNNKPIDVIVGTLIANRWDGDPVWMMMVAPSGGVKTELIVSLDEIDNIVSVDDITPQALVSGSNSTAAGGDPSLIPRLHQNILTIKDFTVTLSRNEQEREQIFSIFRAAYDQKVQRTFGNGAVRNYYSKFGIIVGVTSIIEIFADKHTALGERFLRYLINTPKAFADQKDIVKKAISNSQVETTMRDELKDIMKRAMDFNFGAPPHVPDAIIDKVVGLAKYVSMLRATVFREMYSREITHAPMAELPTRVGKQLYSHLQGMAAFHRVKEVSDVHYETTKDVAISSAPSNLEKIVRGMYIKGWRKEYTTKEICGFTNLPQQTTMRLIENMQATEVLTRLVQGKLATFKLSDEMAHLISLTQIYKEK